MNTLVEGKRNHLTFNHHLDELEEVMEFRLTYDGALMADGGGATHKHEIRKVFHKQLKHLWTIQPILQHWLKPNSAPPIRVEGNALQQSGKSYLESLGDNFNIGNYRFAPLATEAKLAIVSLDILFLRSGKPGSIMKSADLDGRLKTLIDALRMPNQVNEVGEYTSPDEDEKPFYCLMEDDKLVGNIAITADVLLQPTEHANNGYYDTHDARVIVSVSLRAASGGNFGSINWI